jgi:hypothetical protein
MAPRDQLRRAFRPGAWAVCAVFAVAVVGCRATSGDATRPEHETVAPKPPASVPAKPPTAPPPPPAPVDRWGELTRELGAAIRRAGGACPRVASEVKAFVARYRKELAALERAREAWEESATKPSVNAFYRTVRRDLDTRIDAGIKCQSDAAARAAFDAFFVASGLDTRR